MYILNVLGTVLITCVLGNYSLSVSTPKRPIHSLRQSDKFTELSVGSQIGADTLPSKAYYISSDALLTSAKVTRSWGLSEDEVGRRREQYGMNTLSPEKTRTALALVWQSFAEDQLAQVLLAVAAVSALFASVENSAHVFAEPGVIFAIVLLNAAVSVWQSYSAEKCLRELTKLQAENCNVLRSGEWIVMPSRDLVPGDIISLRLGDKVPADCRVIRILSTAFATDESSLTGESEGVLKSTEPVKDIPLYSSSSTSCGDSLPLSMQSCMIFSGTTVTRGSCEAVVVRTGDKTEIGKIREDIKSSELAANKTPLEKSLAQFSSLLVRIVGVICLAMWASNIDRFGAMGSWTTGALHHAKSAVALGVAAVPEGLPAAISLCLSLGTRRMARKKAIIRKLSSLETLGSTSVICTDKTGTLTTNQMTVTSIVTSSGGAAVKERGVEGDSYDPVGRITEVLETDGTIKVLEMFATICSLCNEADLKLINNTYSVTGEPTEGALRVIVEKIGTAASLVYKEDPPVSNTPYNQQLRDRYIPMAQLEFTRERKSMSVLCQKKTSAGYMTPPSDNILFTKGAAEVMLQRCSRVLNEEGKMVPLKGRLRRAWENKVQAMSGRPMRCLALAYKQGLDLGKVVNGLKTPQEASALPILQDTSSYERLESDMVLVGVCGIVDPPRGDVAAAITKCHQAGVRVMMITGDSKDTALAIAREVGIIYDSAVPSESDSYAFTGKEFFSLPYEKQLDILRLGNKVFCRVEPRDKKVLVSMLSQLGEVVAMTGDGVNDASALSAADIGIAMGITGTEVAKGAADMVLADDSFATIVTAIEEGRSIYSNMQTFIGYLISCNIGEIVAIFASSLLGMPEPLSAMHLLWINLVTDGPPAAALSLNPTDGDLMKRKPRRKNKPLLTAGKFARYLISSLYVGLATLYAFAWWYMDKGVSFQQLRTWQSCSSWKGFAHSALAPHWPEKPCDIFTALRGRAQSFSLTVLILMEMLKALEAVSPRKSLLQYPPWRNPWLLLGVSVPLCLHLFLMYSPSLAAVFGLYPLSSQEWKMVLKISLPFIILEELLKLWGRMRRRRSPFTRTSESPLPQSLHLPFAKMRNK